MIFNLSLKHQLPEDAIVIDVTSNSSSFGRLLSPFNLGPVHLYDEYIAQSVENGYSFSKIFEQFDNGNGEPTSLYLDWAKAGWENQKPIKYPLGAWSKHLYFWWDGKKISKKEGFKKIFTPLYKEAVLKTTAYQKLKDMCKNSNKDIYLIDYEGFDYEFLGLSLKDVFDQDDFPIGQGFVLLGMLNGVL